ncbi:YfhO family protein, partial [candidate division KSB3 bacterium]|nr:YfhO family protein [candidate division KSB3 bacterium]MBD3326920.1 YfhO family protein [candidate division KSB3 bacterium]
AGARVNFYAPTAFFTQTPPVVKTVHQTIGDGRLFRSPQILPPMVYVAPDNPFAVPSDHVMWLYRWKFEVLAKYLAAYYQIPVIFHEDYDLLAQKHLMTLTSLIEAMSWERRLPLLSAGAVTLILAPDALSVPGVEQIATIPNLGKVPVFLYANNTAAHRLTFVTQWKMARSDDEALGLMLSPGYDPRQHVVLQASQTSSLWSFLHPVQRQRAAFVAPRECEEPVDAVIKPISATTLSASYAVSTNCEGYLVFADPVYPGWHVTVDGQETALWRANYAFSAIFLPTGTHVIRRYYRPQVLLLGMVSSLLVGGVLLLIASTGWLRPPSKKM